MQLPFSLQVHRLGGDRSLFFETLGFEVIAKKSLIKKEMDKSLGDFRRRIAEIKLVEFSNLMTIDRMTSHGFGTLLDDVEDETNKN